MKLKYSPVKWNEFAKHNLPPWTQPDTQVRVLSETMLELDGRCYEFDTNSINFEGLIESTNGEILEAFRQDGELYVTIRRFYTQGCSEWDTGEYHDVKPIKESVRVDKPIRLTGKTEEQVNQEELDRLANQARQERNRKLAETDWMVLPDAPIRQAEREAVLRYRQALRDIPQQEGFPEKVVWPEKPGGKGIADG